MKYLVGIDLGTSGTKTVLFDQNGVAIKSHTVDYPLYQPHNGWAEQDPADWWNATVEGIRTVIADVNNEDVVGLGISGQMHGLVMLDKNGEVIRNSIIWCDQRTAAQCEEMTQKMGREKLIQITANPALPGFTASKILWVRQNEPENFAKCTKVLLPKDYVRYMLTGDYATEVSDASGMQLLDIPKRKWSEEMLELVGIDESYLGKLYESCEVTGGINRAAAELTGLKQGTKVVGGAGDNFAMALGTGTVSSGRAFVTLGTSGVVFAHADEVSIDAGGRVHTFCSAVPGKWCVMSCTQAAGLSLRWLRDVVCSPEVAKAAETGKDVYDIMCDMAAKVPIGAERLYYLPYLMGERSPHLDSNARGVFFGLSGMHGREHMIRAVLEGVAYSQLDCFEVFSDMGVDINSMIACGGGGKSPLWRQMLADMFECSVAVMENDEGAAIGVAILAAVGAGLYPNVEEACKKMLRFGAVQLHEPQNSKVYVRNHKFYQKLYKDLKEDFAELSTL